jgi:hypothetical protein
MAKPTADESRKMEVNRQIKRIWEERLGRNKNELNPLIYNEFAWKVCTNKKSVNISKGEIDDLLSKSNTAEMKEKTILKIEEELKYLIE